MNYLRCLLVMSGLMVTVSWAPAEDAPGPLQNAVTFYASFDEAVKGDAGGGDLTLSTRFNHETEKNKFVVEKGFDDKKYKVAKDKGIHGGALEASDVLPRNGRIFFPAKGNIAFKKGGWSGALSVWINTDPDKLLKTKFCDPIQITQKGANNGGIWFDFNDAKPRDMRHGVFPAVPEGQKSIAEEDPKAPMVRVPKVGFKSGDWHHIVLSWKNFDTGKKDSVSALYIDGKLIGEVKDYDLTMDWDIDKAGIYVAVNYIGLLDELALFNRALTADEVMQLKNKPGLLAGVKKKDERGQSELDELQKLKKLAEADLEKAKKQLEEAQKERDALLDSVRNQIVRVRDDMLRSWDPEAKDGEHFLSTFADIPPRNVAQPTFLKFPFDMPAAEKYQKEYAEWRGLPQAFTNDLGMKFVFVPPGKFLMGSPSDEPGRNAGGYIEDPLHEVTLTKPFYLGKHEVTVGQFRKFVEATKYITDGEKNDGGNAHDDKAVWKHRPGTNWRKPGYAGPYEQRDDHAVVHVSHTDAKAFCAWLQERAAKADEKFAVKLTYDLPTEAQWEWACRAGSGARYWWGPDEDTTGKVANVGDRSLKKVHPEWPRTIMPMDDGFAFVAPVGSYRANGFGLHDMLGNVWEFCSTRYAPYPKEAVTDPVDGDPKRGFAVRGGGWSNIASDARCASRNADPPHFCHSNLGFRVALLIDKPEK